MPPTYGGLNLWDLVLVAAPEGAALDEVTSKTDDLVGLTVRENTLPLSHPGEKISESVATPLVAPEGFEIRVFKKKDPGATPFVVLGLLGLAGYAISQA